MDEKENVATEQNDNGTLLMDKESMDNMKYHLSNPAFDDEIPGRFMFAARDLLIRGADLYRENPELLDDTENVSWLAMDILRYAQDVHRFFNGDMKLVSHIEELAEQLTRYVRWNALPEANREYSKTMLAIRRIGFWADNFVDFVYTVGQVLEETAAGQLAEDEMKQIISCYSLDHLNRIQEIMLRDTQPFWEGYCNWFRDYGSKSNFVTDRLKTSC